MAQVSVRDLRDHGGEVLDRVLAGETIAAVAIASALLVFTCGAGDFTGINDLDLVFVPHPDHPSSS